MPLVLYKKLKNILFNPHIILYSIIDMKNYNRNNIAT